MKSLNLALISLGILISVATCDKCRTNKDSVSSLEAPLVSAAGLDSVAASNDTTAPIKVGQVTLGQYNQQNHPKARECGCIGNGACTCIVGVFLKELLRDPELNLHQDANKIDELVVKGIEFYSTAFPTDAATNRATFVEDVLSKLDLQQDEATMIDPHEIGFLQTKPLASEADLRQELEQYSDSKKLAIVRTGPEGWALISQGDATFDIFDPHGRPERNHGNSGAFIQRTDLDMATELIWTASPLKADPALDPASWGVYIYWLK